MTKGVWRGVVAAVVTAFSLALTSAAARAAEPTATPGDVSSPFAMRFTTPDPQGDFRSLSSLLDLDADSRPTFFTPRASGMRLGIAPLGDPAGTPESLLIEIPNGRAIMRPGIGVSQTFSNGLELGFGASYSRLSDFESDLLGLSDQVGLDARVSFAGLTFDAAMSRLLSRGIGRELLESGLAEGFGLGVSYDFGPGLVSLSGAHARGGNSLLIDPARRDTVKLSGRYTLSDALNLSAALSMSDTKKQDETPLLLFNDWALLTGFELSF